MDDPTPLLIGFAAVLVLAAFIVWSLRQAWGRHRVRGFRRQQVLRKCERVSLQGDAHRKLMEADALLDEVLGMLGYRGTHADKLKRAGPYILQLNDVWRAHRLRNRIAHEAGVSLSQREADDAVLALLNAVRRFCR